ncbi:MAG: ATP-binding protein [Caldilinea sp. CFX5]|nr:ATP-binding protein [Caldilinea sp. CFX5]
MPKLQLPPTTMQYPLREKIGAPHLFVGREQELKDFHKWVAGMPNLLSQSRALLGRRKSGKTAFVQRLFNQLWSANGAVIPFYFSIPELAMWYPSFVLLYYQTFATQYISFLERDTELVRTLLSMEQIRAYGEANDIAALVNDVDYILHNAKEGYAGLMWDRAYRAPHRIADIYNQRILVILDEFQYLATNIFAHEGLSGPPIASMPGSYHEVSESKVAPMLATGSYIGWMVEIMQKYLEPGGCNIWTFHPT